ncbi:transport protein Avl9-domain-containing protein [Neohortaea acidophila]|uniref:Transport protein Avl9-domain-containing protein n=1 Tax=Neohortaea acidophila TaxID=245834 RepID=A0A6A6PJ21_9PEZI|nr:transport protein Avl9-domain-containing protein [Neohortaea acidophila]KAF2479711.1 transport protein Avl9-domain-containing protein [Neohortaea acidophila]
MFQPLLCVVDFHHARGPEIEHWFGAGDSDPTAENDWHLIPYMALPDGAHQSEEEFSYFSLVHKGREGADVEPTSVFGISCVHHIDSAELVHRPPEVTRSAVQKAVVAITDKPQSFSVLRERLSAVTRAWFAQKDFRDCEILARFQESLLQDGAIADDERDQYFGLSLREVVHTFKWQTLVLLKALLLQPKMLFFGSHCERICQVQFALLSLIPGLVRSLRDCADPQMDRYAETLKRPDSVRTSDRASLLAYMGIPLQVFGKGSLFGPYTPLQQLEILADLGTKSYVVGSTNSLLLQQKDRYCDVLVNLDEDVVNILSPTFRTALHLSTADRRWIDFLTQAVNDTWDDSDPSRSKTHGYAGSEEFIRLQFEEYLLAMLSASKYHAYLEANKEADPKARLADVEGDPSHEFSPAYLDAWRETENYRLWNRTTDSHLFDVVEPRHPCAGGLTIDDVQRRLATQVAELHLDERFNQTKEVVHKRLADGKVHVTTAFNKVWADIEVMREAQRRRADDARASSSSAAAPTENGARDKTQHHSGAPILSKVDLNQAQASVAAAGQKAGAYLSSWGNWANEKRKTAWKSTSASEEAARGGHPAVGAFGKEDFAPRIIRLTDKAKNAKAAEEEKARSSGAE